MNLFEELNELRRVFIPWIWIWIGFSIFFFGFGFQKIQAFGFNIFYPATSLQSISVQFLQMAKKDLLPNQVQIITINPLNAFLSLTIISLLLAFIFSFPFFLYKLIRYLSPALYQKEKKAIFKVLIPSSFLFVSGCLFAYFLIIPLTFKILYSFTTAIGVEPFFSINEFVSLVLSLMILVGIIFLLPIFMSLLTQFGIIEGNFWKKNWRYAVFTFLVFSAVITPDGTGITMLLLSLPLSGLYFLGVILTRNK